MFRSTQCYIYVETPLAVSTAVLGVTAESVTLNNSIRGRYNKLRTEVLSRLHLWPKGEERGKNKSKEKKRESIVLEWNEKTRVCAFERPALNKKLTSIAKRFDWKL